MALGIYGCHFTGHNGPHAPCWLIPAISAQGTIIKARWLSPLKDIFIYSFFSCDLHHSFNIKGSVPDDQKEVKHTVMYGNLQLFFVHLTINTDKNVY